MSFWDARNTDHPLDFVYIPPDTLKRKAETLNFHATDNEFVVGNVYFFFFFAGGSFGGNFRCDRANVDLLATASM